MEAVSCEPVNLNIFQHRGIQGIFAIAPSMFYRKILKDAEFGKFVKNSLWLVTRHFKLVTRSQKKITATGLV